MKNFAAVHGYLKIIEYVLLALNDGGMCRFPVIAGSHQDFCLSSRISLFSCSRPALYVSVFG